MSNWRLFKENFSVIEEFFETANDDMVDKQIPFNHISIRLIMSYGDKGFELVKEEDSHTSGDQLPTKQYRRCLIYNKVSFDRLKMLKH